MTLQDLILAVKEKSLSKEQLEAYHDQMSMLFAEMCVELAELEKAEAFFLETMKRDEESVAAIKIRWKATTQGQREIVLKRYLLATKELLNSLKSRTFRLIY